jgi:hypothetical protein
MRVLLPIPLLIVLANPAFGQDDSLLRCRAVADASARLACYDALADRQKAAAASPAAPVAPVAAAGAKPGTAPAVAVAAAPAPVPAARTAEAAFGLPEPKRPGAVESVTSSVGPNFSGWGPNSRIRLANGQVWQVVDGTSVALPEGARKVSVKRGALSSFYLDIEGLNTSPRVRRVE